MAQNTDPSENSPFIGALPISPVARRPNLMGALVGGIGVGLLGVFVFVSLNSQRTASAPPAGVTNQTAPAIPQTGVMPASPPGATAASATPSPDGLAMNPIIPMVDGALPQGLPVAQEMGTGLGTAMPTPNASGDSAHAPVIVVDLSGGRAGLGYAGRAGAPAQAASAGAGASPAAADASANDPDARFSARVAAGTADATTPSRLSDKATTAPQGTVIPAVLETAINSDQPGFVRAVVSRDVRGYDGTTVLIPRSSRLIGQYRNALAVGQSRAFVVWTRLLTPDGLSLDIQSPGTDRLGRTGLEGETHTHFFRRFGNAILLSVLNAGLQAAATRGGTNTAIVIGSQQQASNIASQALQKDIDIPYTVTVDQGAAIQVFLARDLDFSGVVGRRK